MTKSNPSPTSGLAKKALLRAVSSPSPVPNPGGAKNYYNLVNRLTKLARNHKSVNDKSKMKATGGSGGEAKCGPCKEGDEKGRRGCCGSSYKDTRNSAAKYARRILPKLVTPHSALAYGPLGALKVRR